MTGTDLQVCGLLQQSGSEAQLRSSMILLDLSSWLGWWLLHFGRYEHCDCQAKQHTLCLDLVWAGLVALTIETSHKL